MSKKIKNEVVGMDSSFENLLAKTPAYIQLSSRIIIPRYGSKQNV